jgi:hypothetical protein
VNHNLGQPDPRLWDENGPDCGVLGTPFIGDELDTAGMNPSRTIRRGQLQITLPANGGLSAIDRPNNTWDSFDWAPLDIADEEFPDGRIASWGAGQLGKQHGGPFLLAVGFYKPHQPFFAPRKYFDLYDPTQIALPKTIGGDLYDIPQPGRELATRPWTSGTHRTVMQHGAWRDAVRAYLATVSFVDALVGKVIDALDRGPHADNTWIILWSDHGWSLGEKEHWGKHVPWRESVRMPLLIVPPKNARPEGFTAGARCGAAVSLLDLYPTLLEACGLPNRKELEGRSLLPLVAEPETKWNEAVVATSRGPCRSGPDFRPVYLPMIRVPIPGLLPDACLWEWLRRRPRHGMLALSFRPAKSSRVCGPRGSNRRSLAPGRDAQRVANRCSPRFAIEARSGS